MTLAGKSLRNLAMSSVHSGVMILYYEDHLVVSETPASLINMPFLPFDEMLMLLS